MRYRHRRSLGARQQGVGTQQAGVQGELQLACATVVVSSDGAGADEAS